MSAIRPLSGAKRTSASETRHHRLFLLRGSRLPPSSAPSPLREPLLIGGLGVAIDFLELACPLMLAISCTVYLNEGALETAQRPRACAPRSGPAADDDPRA